MEKTKKALDHAAALSRAQSYCALAERCAHQVKQKLRLWGAAECDYEDIIERLRSRDFINHRRYAHAFARDKHRLSGWGAQRIARELRARHIEAEHIQSALAELAEEHDIQAKLRTTLEGKLKTFPPNLDRRKAYERLMRYGLYRGYDYDAVSSLAEGLLRALNKAED